jgi:hypothetical protein
MQILRTITIGWLGAIAAAQATEPAAAPVMEEVVVTAKYPSPAAVEEVVVTALALEHPDTAGDTAQRTEELEAELRSRLREYAYAAPPQLHF